MIIEYHRPEKLTTALELLSRATPPTFPMGGGTVLNQPSHESVAVVDLQSLGLDGLEIQGKNLVIGAAATLHSLMNNREIQPALVESIRHDGTFNLRQVATIAGTLISSGGRSPFSTAILALDPQITIHPGGERVRLGDFLPIRENLLPGRLITQITIPLNVNLAYRSVSRTPADLPIVCAAVARWPSGRTRVVLGGYGESVMLAFDGPEADGAQVAAADAYKEACDQWATAAYRSEIADVLTNRCLTDLGLGG